MDISPITGQIDRPKTTLLRCQFNLCGVQENTVSAKNSVRSAGLDGSIDPVAMCSRCYMPRERSSGVYLAVSFQSDQSFMTYDLGYLDLEQRTLQTIENPFGTKVSTMSPGWTSDGMVVGAVCRETVFVILDTDFSDKEGKNREISRNSLRRRWPTPPFAANLSGFSLCFPAQQNRELIRTSRAKNIDRRDLYRGNSLVRQIGPKFNSGQNFGAVTLRHCGRVELKYRSASSRSDYFLPRVHSFIAEPTKCLA